MWCNVSFYSCSDSLDMKQWISAINKAAAMCSDDTFSAIEPTSTQLTHGFLMGVSKSTLQKKMKYYDAQVCVEKWVDLCANQQ